MVIVSDSLDHTKPAVFKFVDYVFSLLKTEHSDIEFINVFSDGPSSQFKQRYLFSNLFLFEQSHKIQVTWNFFATSHGKGVVDGIGGAIKRTVWRHVKAGKINISSAEQFSEVAKALNPSIHGKYISRAEIENDKHLFTRWDTVLTFPNIHSVHCVKPLGPKKVQISDMSNANECKIDNIFKSDSSDDEISEADVDDPICDSLNVNNWVVVRYDDNLYPGCVTQMTEKEIEVTVMHRSEGNYKWPHPEDKIFYKSEDVIKIIDPPIPAGNRGQFLFNNSF